METKFTPGPWKAGKNPCMTTVLDGHEGKAIYMDEPNDPHHIAWANAENTEGELDIETALANATLIATAPEMFNMLEKFVEITETSDVVPLVFFEHASRVKKILRKARGEE